MSEKRLGRGLEALIPTPDSTDSSQQGEVKMVEVEEIKPNPYQPREGFDKKLLEELSVSIREHGLIQPVTLRKKGDGGYQLVAGERRWKGAKLAGLESIPAIIQDYNEQQMMEVALIENLQREDLNPIEEAKAYQKLIDEFDLIQAEVAERVGKSRSAIANSLRLLNLAPELQKDLADNRLTVGHVRALLTFDDFVKQKEVAKELIENELTVRETERLIKKLTAENSNSGDKSKKEVTKKDPNLVMIEDSLRKKLGTQVSIKDGEEKGQIVIEYYSTKDLDRILTILKDE
ncbi:ParB/RepB/Spo0J family partition protein [Fuchsiella alkaliacetigena]|nr:ParB/RepB/Spo0J family partition protein [Fuchsiella alkaliacetigena]MCK8824538.1 ParB/RepB/Spo0J family partition protein [Fuchsiella alkaliacetigena]